MQFVETFLQWPEWAEYVIRLGQTAQSFLWQGTAVAAGYAALRSWVAFGPAGRYRLAVASLFLATLLPAVTFWKMGPLPKESGPLVFTEEEGSLEPVVVEISTSETPTEVAPSTTKATDSPLVPASIAMTSVSQPVRPSWHFWGGIGWVAGFFLIAIPRILGWGLLQHWRQAAVAAPPELMIRFRALAERCGLRRRVTLLVTQRRLPPLSAGWLRPFIMLPAALISQASGLPPAQLDAILAHELAHIRRGDYVVNLVQTLVETLLFFHPAIWWLSREIRKERELCCDDAAVQTLTHSLPLAEALASLAHWRNNHQLTLAQGFSQSPLLERMQRLLGGPVVAPARPALALPMALLACVALSPVFTPAETPNQAKSEPTVEPQAPVEPPPALKKIRGALLDRNGIALAKSTSTTDRQYPLGSLFAHAVGYTRWEGKWGESTITGAAAAEAANNDELAAGHDVRLTLDAGLQAITRQALVDASVGRGSAVLADPDTGALLAVVSLPDFAPTQFFPSVDKAWFDAMLKDETTPFQNRSLLGQAPGSAFKPLVGLAGLESGLGSEVFTCEQYVRVGDRNFHCWVVQKGINGHGTLGLSDSLKHSCNCYYYNLGLKLGRDKIATTAERFGIGTRQNFGLGQMQAGFIGKPASPLSEAPFTANLAIGQGETKWTPVQATMVASTIANGGKVWKPYAVAETSQGKPKPELAYDFTATIANSEIAKLRQGMHDTVNADGGTGRKARSERWLIAGKTSTAQFIRKGKMDNLTSFIAFAPFEKPKLALTVNVQNGTAGGAVCAPIAKRILEQALASLETPTAAASPAPTKPHAGHLNRIEAVDYGVTK